MPANAELGELPEKAFRGPFGGWQSELPPDGIEDYGFAGLANIILRKGVATVRPSFTAIALLPNPQEAIVGIADFFDKNGLRHQVVITPTRMFVWVPISQSWTQVTGTLTGPASGLFTWTVVSNKLLFSQGKDPVQLWDGITAGFAAAAGAAVPAFYMCELNSYPLFAYTVEAGQNFPQRIRWTSPGDPTTWTGPSAGLIDLNNALGPIQGIVKLWQSVYAIQQFGITQIIPTGFGLGPFATVPLSSTNRGTLYPYSIASEGGEYCAYVGLDNVYLFDGTTPYPIGDQPIDGRKRIGARRAIFQDLTQSAPGTVYGYITTIVAGNDFNAYWLAIPAINVIWVYNLDEGNWTRWTFTKSISLIGRFALNRGIRWLDLIGPWTQQNAPWNALGTNFQDGVLIGFNDGTPGYVDFTNFSEQSWSITSGQLTFGDQRHQKTVKKFRISIQDFGQITFNITVTGVIYPNPNATLDSSGQPISTNGNTTTQTKSVTMGNGSGQSVSRVIDFSVPGNYITYSISGNAGAAASFAEFAPIYDTSGEQRGA